MQKEDRWLEIVREEDDTLSALAQDIQQNILPMIQANAFDVVYDILSIRSYIRYFSMLPHLIVFHVRKAGTRIFLPQWAEKLAIQDLGSTDYYEARAGAERTTVIYRYDATIRRYVPVYKDSLVNYWEGPIKDIVESCDRDTLLLSHFEALQTLPFKNVFEQEAYYA